MQSIHKPCTQSTSPQTYWAAIHRCTLSSTTSTWVGLWHHVTQPISHILSRTSFKIITNKVQQHTYRCCTGLLCNTTCVACCCCFCRESLQSKLQPKLQAVHCFTYGIMFSSLPTMPANDTFQCASFGPTSHSG